MFLMSLDTMDGILVIDGYNRLLCIDVYLPDYGTTSSMRPIEISASTHPDISIGQRTPLITSLHM